MGLKAQVYLYRLFTSQIVLLYSPFGLSGVEAQRSPGLRLRSARTDLLHLHTELVLVLYILHLFDRLLYPLL